MSNQPIDQLEISYEIGSGNVFADLGLPDPDLALAKADLAMRLGRVIEEHGWRSPAAAYKLETGETALRSILFGDLGDWSLERLLVLLTKAGFDARITVAPSGLATGSIAVDVIRD